MLRRLHKKYKKYLKELVENIQIVEKFLGKIHYVPTKGETENIGFQKSLFVVNDMELGEIFTEENIRFIRPANGLEPKYLAKILGKKAKKDIKKWTPLS